MTSSGGLQEKHSLDMEIPGPSRKVKKMTRLKLYNILKEFIGKGMAEKFSLLEDKLMEMTSCPVEEKNVLTRSLRFFKTSFKHKWFAAHRTDERFLQNNAEWLKTSLELPVWSHKSGRPAKQFQELSDRSKRRRTKELRDKVPVEELTYAARVSLGTSGNTDTSVIIKEITSTPTRANKFRKIVSSAKKEQALKKYTPQEALELFVEGDFTRRQWELIQGDHKEIYPCYTHIQKAKKVCYLKEENIKVTETFFEVGLQALLDHTATRLSQYLKEVTDTLSVSEKQNLVLISKWGCDGSHQTQFRQTFENASDNDSNIFLSSLVPVRMTVSVKGDMKKIVRQNPVPSSVRFCQPIRARFVHETKDITKEELRYIEGQALILKETEIEEIAAKITHKLLLTMVDGKVCNAAMDNSSTMRCYVCGQTSKDFNKLKKTSVKKEALQFGLSILHARIRFFELILHVAYKAPIKKWQVRTAEDKKIIKETKKNIQKRFREEMGLLVDIPKPGYGISNDGNTSRRFFENPECSSEITGINIDLIKRFKIIPEVISSGHEIDHIKFDLYAQTTGKLYVELYGWHPMSPTVHKVLMHGAEVIAEAIVPIGQLSEEAAEARNKHFRKYRVDIARKFSRVSCNRDILNRLLLTSDPYISCNRIKRKKTRTPFSSEALNMFLSSKPHQDSSDEDQTIPTEIASEREISDSD